MPRVLFSRAPFTSSVAIPGPRSLSINANEKRVVESEVGIVRDLREHKPGCNKAEAGVVLAPGDVAPEDGHGVRFDRLRDFVVIAKSPDGLNVC